MSSLCENDLVMNLWQFLLAISMILSHNAVVKQSPPSNMIFV